MKGEIPTISVIIPSYNYAHFLAASIQSVLAQRGDDFRTEVIVVDDGSKDNTREVAQGFGAAIKYIFQDNQGLSAARNTGIKNATGDFIVFLDADDLIPPDYVRRQLDNFEKNEAADISVCHCVLVDANSRSATLWPLKADNLGLHLCYSNVAPVHAFMSRAAAVKETGFFDTKRKACEDYDYWLRMAVLGKRFAVETGTFAIYRRHGGSMTGQSLHQFLNDVAVRQGIRKALEHSPDFPGVPKYLGWLAYAAGTLASSIGLTREKPGLAQEMVNHSAEALLEGAKYYSQAEFNTYHLIQSERYYTWEYFLTAGWYGKEYSSALNKALLFLSRRNPSLGTATPKHLSARKNILFRNLLANYATLGPELKNFRLPET